MNRHCATSNKDRRPSPDQAAGQRYLAARQEEERKLVEDMLEIGIIQESSSAFTSPAHRGQLEHPERCTVLL